MRYFDLSEDIYIKGRWRLGTPRDPSKPEEERIVTWTFLKGSPYQFNKPLKLPLREHGVALDFTMADINAVPVVHVRVAALLAELAPSDIQLIPVEIDSHPDQYCLMNVTRIVKCIDDARCTEVEYWKPEDGRPEKTGTYRGVIGLKIDPSKVGDARIFRPWGWEIALIVSEEIKEALERAGVTGMKFEQV